MMGTKRSRSAYDGPRYSAKGFTQQYNPYKEALLNPISGPLVGVPTPVPVDTHRARLKATGTITVTSGSMTAIAQPTLALCNDLVAMTSGAALNVGPVVYNDAEFIDPAFTVGAVDGSLLSNANYTRGQFGGVAGAGASSVRGRVVSACMRICNVSAANTRNGVFTLFQDPQHTTLQGKRASGVATDPKARQYNASSDAWHTVTYHPVEPEEVDGWVWDPAVGPQSGVKTGQYNATAGAVDGSLADNFPGFMGIFWRGDVVSQTFQVELYVIAEYVGSLVQPLVRPIGVNIEDAQGAREAAEDVTAHMSSAEDGANHTGHPHSDTHPSRAQRLLDFGKEHAGALKQAGKVAAVGVSGLMGGPAAARTVAELLYTQGQLANVQATADRYSALKGQRTPGRMSSGARIPTPRMTSTYNTPSSAARLTYSSRVRSSSRR